MSELLLPFLAVLAGVLSFSSPCCLPLIPGYLSYVSAIPVSELGRVEARRVTLRAALLFVAGFTVVFTLLGVSFAFAGAVLLRQLPLIVRMAGGVIIVMGLAMMGLLRIPFLYRERRFDMSRIPQGPGGAFALGMAFAFGWVPCIGPILATILATAAAAQTAAWGAVLLVLYSLGLGVPFVALALGFQRARGSLEWLRRHGRGIEVAGGALLVGIGVLFVSGAWRTFFIPLQRYFARWGWPPI
ncbi:MAG TPA: cytochrome c biogenesis protein CcdA [Acidimicrobiales bacterium]|nr:cytochrome c biogenesis protein CcdA [Acidimicrobiales bacterium]